MVMFGAQRQTRRRRCRGLGEKVRFCWAACTRGAMWLDGEGKRSRTVVLYSLLTLSTWNVVVGGWWVMVGGWV